MQSWPKETLSQVGVGSNIAQNQSLASMKSIWQLLPPTHMKMWPNMKLAHVIICPNLFLYYYLATIYVCQLFTYIYILTLFAYIDPNWALFTLVIFALNCPDLTRCAMLVNHHVALTRRNVFRECLISHCPRQWGLSFVFMQFEKLILFAFKVSPI